MFGSMDVIEPVGSASGGPSGPQIVLGVQELNQNGICQTWLLKRAVAEHLRQVEEESWHSSCRVVDGRGRPACAVITSAAITGFASAFSDRDPVTLSTDIRACGCGRHQSKLILRSVGGAQVVVRLVSRLVRPVAGSNRDLVRAGQTQDCTIGRRCADFIRRRPTLVSGPSIPEAAEHTVAVCPETHVNQFGLMSLSAFASCFAQAERLCPGMPVDGAALVSREMAFLGNIDPGDALVIATVSRRDTVDGLSGIVTKSWARRRSDDRLIAVSHSVRQAG